MKEESFDLATKCLVPVSGVPLLPQNIAVCTWWWWWGDKPQNLCWDPAWLNVLQVCVAD